MNEAENQVRPDEEDANTLIDFNDIAEQEKQDEIDNEEFIATEEDTSEPDTEAVDQPVEPDVKDEVDFTPLLNKLSKDIKFMDEEITIDSYDDIVKNYQKGLALDKKTEKLKELQNSPVVTFVNKLAEESGITPEEYIQQVEQMQVDQAKQEEQNYLNTLVDKGMDEEEAKTFAEDRRVTKELKKELNQIKKEKMIRDKEATHKKENADFLENHQDVDLKSIPNSVYVEAETIGLEAAFAKHENNSLKEQLKILKQNTANQGSSPVKATTTHGGVVVAKEDDFLKGLDV